MSKKDNNQGRLRVGFIGLGMMGLPMVQALAKTDRFEILAFDKDKKPFDTLRTNPAWAQSLHRATNLAALKTANIIITMLPNSTITNDVMTGQGGLIEHIADHMIVIDMGSSNPQDTVRLGGEIAARGGILLDAPVSGAVAKANAGTLTIMVGGPEQAIEAARPVLEAMSSQILPTGALGSAHAMKALNNYVYAAGLLAVSEATVIASAMGFDLARFNAVLNASSGRNVASETKLSQFIIPRHYAGGFALRLQAKDLDTAAKLQALTGVPTPLLTLCDTIWNKAVGALPQGADNTEIHHYIEQLSHMKAKQDL